ASIAAFWLPSSTARVTDMWGRTTTSSMGRTGSSSDLGVVIFTRERLPRTENSQSCWAVKSGFRLLGANGPRRPSLNGAAGVRGSEFSRLNLTQPCRSARLGVVRRAELGPGPETVRD